MISEKISFVRAESVNRDNDTPRMERGNNWFVIRGPKDILVDFGVRVIKALKNTGSNGDVRTFKKTEKIIIDAKYRIIIEKYLQWDELIIDGSRVEGNENLTAYFNDKVASIKL